MPPLARYVEHTVVKHLEGIRIWGYRVRGAMVGFREQRNVPRPGANPRTLIAESAAGESQETNPNSDNNRLRDIEKQLGRIEQLLENQQSDDKKE